LSSRKTQTPQAAAIALLFFNASLRCCAQLLHRIQDPAALPANLLVTRPLIFSSYSPHGWPHGSMMCESTNPGSTTPPAYIQFSSAAFASARRSTSARGPGATIFPVAQPSTVPFFTSPILERDYAPRAGPPRSVTTVMPL